MVWNNVYLSTPNPVGNFQGSAASTVFSDVSISGGLDVGTLDAAGAVTLSAALNSASALSAGEATFTGGNFTSTITSTDGDFLSVETQANASGMTTGQLRLVFAASGVSLMYSSGETSYTVGVSTVSVAQA